MLAMSTVARAASAPFKTIFGYATLFGEDGRPMHKSWGNSIEFDEAAERMGADVMRWMYAKARPEDNILFGWHAADEARRELLVLWNVVRVLRHLRPAGRLDAAGGPGGPSARGNGPRPLSEQGKAQVLVVLKAQADFIQLKTFETREERIQFVYDSLVRVADASQKDF